MGRGQNTQTAGRLGSVFQGRKQKKLQSEAFGHDLLRICSGKNRSALRFAAEHHKGQKRKAKGMDIDYFLHPVAVSEVAIGAGADRNVAVAAVLHDVLEDTDATEEDIRREFGQDVLEIVLACTKGPEMKGVRLEDQAPIILAKLDAKGRDAWAVKAADLLVNMTDLVLDAENHGVEDFARIFKAERVEKKIRHYLKLSEGLQQRLTGTKYYRLAPALAERSAELLELLEEYLKTSAS